MQPISNPVIWIYIINIECCTIIILLYKYNALSKKMYSSNNLLNWRFQNNKDFLIFFNSVLIFFETQIIIF